MSGLMKVNYLLINPKKGLLYYEQNDKHWFFPSETTFSFV